MSSIIIGLTAIIAFIVCLFISLYDRKDNGYIEALNYVLNNRDRFKPVNDREWYYQINFDKGYIVSSYEELNKLVKKHGYEIKDITLRYEYVGNKKVKDNE